jgi:radical SAM superfamily enzyme YgiQ (UPF0313 family)
MLSPKKRDHALARRQLYLNYGALSLATKLHFSGYNVALFHGEHRDPADVLRQLREQDRFPSAFPLMVSIPSFYALQWAQAFCRNAKAVDSECRIIVGGRWVVGPDPKWLRGLLPEADVLAPGLSEGIIERLLTENLVLKRSVEPTPSFTLHHPLVDSYRRYQPSVEASRGCGMGCTFCEERDIKVEKLRDAAAVAASIATVREQFDGEPIRPYLQSSMFIPSARWAADLAEEATKIGFDIAWRTETRVDAMTPRILAALAEAGLRVIDLGLETASPRQLLAMNKTDAPDRYLRRASELVDACSKHGVMAKINVLLYPGETEDTLAETTDWLDAHATSITGVSVGPVIAYGPPKTAARLLDSWRTHGARPVDETSAATTGITTMHLSADFSAAAAEAASLRLARRYMDEDAYFTLKSFSYYPRDYSRADFDLDVAASDPSVLPFTLNQCEAGAPEKFERR